MGSVLYITNHTNNTGDGNRYISQVLADFNLPAIDITDFVCIARKALLAMQYGKIDNFNDFMIDCFIPFYTSPFGKV